MEKQEVMRTEIQAVIKRLQSQEKALKESREMLQIAERDHMMHTATALRMKIKRQSSAVESGQAMLTELRKAVGELPYEDKEPLAAVREAQKGAKR